MNPEEIQRIKDLLPTTLGSEEIRGTIAADILRRSVFSARMASATYLAQIRDVVYETHDRAATNKVAWVDWQTTETITHNGRTWEGCHRCTVTRPTWAQGVTCLDLPNDRLGGPSGFDFGDLLVTVGGDPAYTGIVSNGVTGAVLYFDNGFCKGTPQ